MKSLSVMETVLPLATTQTTGDIISVAFTPFFIDAVLGVVVTTDGTYIGIPAPITGVGKRRHGRFLVHFFFHRDTWMGSFGKQHQHCNKADSVDSDWWGLTSFNTRSDFPLPVKQTIDALCSPGRVTIEGVLSKGRKIRNAKEKRNDFRKRKSKDSRNNGATEPQAHGSGQPPCQGPQHDPCAQGRQGKEAFKAHHPQVTEVTEARQWQRKGTSPVMLARSALKDSSILAKSRVRRLTARSA